MYGWKTYLFSVLRRLLAYSEEGLFSGLRKPEANMLNTVTQSKTMQTTVTFEYDEEAKKWEVYVFGVENEIEAVQAFNAVLITTHEAIVGMHHKAEFTALKRYKILVGI